MNLHRTAWFRVALSCSFLTMGCAAPPPLDIPLVRDVDEKTLWRAEAPAGNQPSVANRQSLRVQDPYMWVYNASFAKDFGMPERWVDNSLAGADALAFRTTQSFPMCGWGGNPAACRVSSKCVLEMYFHHDRHPLPWNEALRWTDMWLRETSVKTMYTLRSLDRIDSFHWPKPPLVDENTREELKWWNVHSSKDRSGGGAQTLAYDRTAFDSYALVVLNYDCTSSDLAGLNLAVRPPHYQDAKTKRAIRFPSSFREKMERLIKKVSEEDREFFNGQLKKLHQLK